LTTLTIDGDSQGHNLACERSSFYTFFDFFRFRFLDFVVPLELQRQKKRFWCSSEMRKKEWPHYDEKVSARRWKRRLAPSDGGGSLGCDDGGK